jgi:hypothetical protein
MLCSVCCTILFCFAPLYSVLFHFVSLHFIFFFNFASFFILFYIFHSILSYSVMFCSILFYSILLCSVLIYSILCTCTFYPSRLKLDTLCLSKYMRDIYKHIRVALCILSCGSRLLSIHNTVIRHLGSDFLHPSCNPFESELKEAVVYEASLVPCRHGAVK